MNLETVLALPRSGVVILTKGKSVLICYSTSMGSQLAEIYNMFRGQAGIHLEVVSANADIETLKLHTEYYRNRYYTDLQYRPIMEYGRATLKYKVRMVPSSDLKYMDVELVTTRGDSKVVGKFKGKLEAKDFIETYYGTDNPIKMPVYAANSATKEFLQKEQTKVLDLK